MSVETRASIRRHINLPNHAASLPFSDAVLIGDTLYLSGRVGLDPATGAVPSSMDDEVGFLLDSFEAVLSEAEMTMDDLVWVQVLSPNVSPLGVFQPRLSQTLHQGAACTGLPGFGSAGSGRKV